MCCESSWALHPAADRIGVVIDVQGSGLRKIAYRTSCLSMFMSIPGMYNPTKKTVDFSVFPLVSGKPIGYNGDYI